MCDDLIYFINIIRHKSYGNPFQLQQNYKEYLLRLGDGRVVSTDQNSMASCQKEFVYMFASIFDVCTKYFPSKKTLYV